MKHFYVDKLEVTIAETNQEMGEIAAKAIAKDLRTLLSQKDEVNVMFGAAPSQNTTLKALLDCEGIDWTRVNAFHMDEYVGITPDRPQSFRNYLNEHIFKHKPFKTVNLIEGENPNIAKVVEDYEKKLRKGGLDLIVLGIGETGHIAFNDPPEAKFDDPHYVRIVKLEELSRIQQVHDGCFASLDEVPTDAVTVTIPAFVNATYLHCAVPGPTKATAAKATLENPVSEMCPASVLRRHPNAHLYLDSKSSADLERF